MIQIEKYMEGMLQPNALKGKTIIVTFEVVTIDGGEWLRNGGEFNHLESVPDQMWDELEKRRSK